ncbi:MAG: hypothetical protein JEZ08_23625 [Clostridiales bacterium]|nr:hypothetical protein [Clostridiales bacterium]
MVFRTNGNMGCGILILVLIVFILIMRFAGWLVFGTPVGLVLLAYIIYRYFKNNKPVAGVTQNEYEQTPEFTSTDEVIDVDYEDYE